MASRFLKKRRSSLYEQNQHEIRYDPFQQQQQQGMYTRLYKIFALMYLLFYPLSIFCPRLFAVLFVEPELTATTFVPYQRLFWVVITTVSPAYFFALNVNQLELFDLFCFQRVFIVFPAIVLTVLSKQMVYDDGHPLLAVFVVDVVGALLHGALFAPDGGWFGIWKRLIRHRQKEPLTVRHEALRFESHMGILHGIMVAVQMALNESNHDNKLAAFTVTVAITLQFVLIWYAAHDQSDVSTKAVLGARILFYWSIWHLAEGGDEQRENAATALFPFLVARSNLRMHYTSLFLGALWPCLGGTWSGVGILYSYFTTYSKYIGGDGEISNHGEGARLLYWMIGWAVVVLLASFWWSVQVSYNDEKQRNRLERLHQQDVYFAAFMIVVAAVLARTQTLGAKTVGEPLGYLFPLVTLWYSNQAKWLNHYKIGSPFLPSWWLQDDGITKLAQSKAVNLFFGIAATLCTVILTFYSFFAIYISLDVDGILGLPNENETEVWKFAAYHGMWMIVISGLWMTMFVLVASPKAFDVGTEKEEEEEEEDNRERGMLQRAIKRTMTIMSSSCSLLENVHHCVWIHKMDMVAGMLFLAIGACLDNENLPFLPSLSFLSGKYCWIKASVFTFWVASILSKVSVHYNWWVHQEQKQFGSTRTDAVPLEKQSFLQRLTVILENWE